VKSVSIAELKAKLSHYLKQVQAGEEVLVVSRGKPVARIVPLDPDSDMAHDAWMQELIRTGRMRPARGKLPPDFWDSPRPEDPEGTALKTLLGERRGAK